MKKDKNHSQFLAFYIKSGTGLNNKVHQKMDKTSYIFIGTH